MSPLGARVLVDVGLHVLDDLGDARPRVRRVAGKRRVPERWAAGTAAVHADRV